MGGRPAWTFIPGATCFEIRAACRSLRITLCSLIRDKKTLRVISKTMNNNNRKTPTRRPSSQKKWSIQRKQISFVLAAGPWFALGLNRDLCSPTPAVFCPQTLICSGRKSSSLFPAGRLVELPLPGLIICSALLLHHNRFCSSRKNQHHHGRHILI